MSNDDVKIMVNYPNSYRIGEKLKMQVPRKPPSEYHDLEDLK